MRILVISDLLPPRALGGFELAALNLSNGLRERGHDVMLLTTPSDRFAPDQEWVTRSLNLRELFVNVPANDGRVQTHLDHESRVSNISNSLIIIDVLRRFQPDHVMLFNLVGIGGLAIIDLLNEVGVPWTMNLGDNVPGALLRGVDDSVADVYGARDGLFAQGRVAIVSQTLLEEIRETGVDLGPRVNVIPRGVIVADTERTRPYQENGHTRFVAAGILSPHKGVDIMIDALASLREQGYDDFSLEIYGGGLVDEYRAVVAQRGLSDYISIPGPVSQRELVRIHARSDAFVFPTWEREPGASAPFEAAAAGCLPIVTGDSGPAERLVDEVHCLKISRTAADLSEAMGRVIRGEVDLATLGRAGRALASGDLSFATSIDRLEALLLEGEAINYDAGSVDFDEVVRTVIHKDDAALRASYATFERGVPGVSSTPEPAPRPPLGERGIFAYPRRLARRIARPIVREELRDQRRAIATEKALIDEMRSELDRRESDVTRREEALLHEIKTIRKDLVATNHRITWLEGQRGGEHSDGAA